MSNSKIIAIGDAGIDRFLYVKEYSQGILSDARSAWKKSTFFKLISSPSGAEALAWYLKHLYDDYQSQYECRETLLDVNTGKLNQNTSRYNRPESLYIVTPEPKRTEQDVNKKEYRIHEAFIFGERYCAHCEAKQCIKEDPTIAKYPTVIMDYNQGWLRYMKLPRVQMSEDFFTELTSKGVPDYVSEEIKKLQPIEKVFVKELIDEVLLEIIPQIKKEVRQKLKSTIDALKQNNFETIAEAINEDMIKKQIDTYKSLILQCGKEIEPLYRSQLTSFVKKRSYIIRTNNLLDDVWKQVRENNEDLRGKGIWFSSYQDMDKSLHKTGTWEDISNLIIDHLKSDSTLWNNSKECWYHFIIVLIAKDGAIVLGPEIDKNGKLLIYRGCQPGSFSRKGFRRVVGGNTVFVSSLVESILGNYDTIQDTIQKKIDNSVRKGLVRIRKIVERGYEDLLESKDDTVMTNLPIIDDKDLEGGLNKIRVYEEPPMGNWKTFCSIVKGNENEFLGNIVLKFGDLSTASVKYARRLLSLTSTLEAYITKNIENARTFSFAIFGKPGSGKTYVAKNIKEAITGKTIQDIHVIECNMSECDEISFNNKRREIQDTILKGKIPFVIWDEFDTFYGGNKAGWLSKFISPMEEVGKRIYVFVGGIFEDQSKFIDWTKTDKGIELKGPDFHRRLAGHLLIPPSDIYRNEEKKGVDYSEDEILIDRAITIRKLLENKTQVKKIENRVFAYLLFIPLRHGIGSLDKLIENSELSNTDIFKLHHLPHRYVRHMHVKDDDKYKPENLNLDEFTFKDDLSLKVDYIKGYGKEKIIQFEW